MATKRLASMTTQTGLVGTEMLVSQLDRSVHKFMPATGAPSAPAVATRCRRPVGPVTVESRARWPRDNFPRQPKETDEVHASGPLQRRRHPDRQAPCRGATEGNRRIPGH